MVADAADDGGRDGRRRRRTLVDHTLSGGRSWPITEVQDSTQRLDSETYIYVVHNPVHGI